MVFFMFLKIRHGSLFQEFLNQLKPELSTGLMNLVTAVLVLCQMVSVVCGVTISLESLF